MDNIEIFCGECQHYVEKYDQCDFYTTEVVKTYKGYETKYYYLFPVTDNKNNDCKQFEKIKEAKIISYKEKFIDYWNRKLYV